MTERAELPLAHLTRAARSRQPRTSPTSPRRPRGPVTLREARVSFERDYIRSVLRAHGWRVRDAARTLGIERANLYRKVRQLGIAMDKRARSA